MLRTLSRHSVFPDQMNLAKKLQQEYPLEKIEADMEGLEKEILAMLKEVTT